jgi:hypothetical protein
VNDFERQWPHRVGIEFGEQPGLKPKPLWNCTCAPPSDNPMIAFG